MKTAMQELTNYMKTYFHLTDESLEMFDKALEKEREQLLNAFRDDSWDKSFNEYYNETYNQQ